MCENQKWCACKITYVAKYYISTSAMCTYSHRLMMYSQYHHFLLRRVKSRHRVVKRKKLVGVRLWKIGIWKTHTRQGDILSSDNKAIGEMMMRKPEQKTVWYLAGPWEMLKQDFKTSWEDILKKISGSTLEVQWF